jgi:IS30 family transposase
MHNFKIEDRRRRVATLSAQSMIEQGIADKLGVDRSTISRDIKVLKKLSQRFVFNLAHHFLQAYTFQKWYLSKIYSYKNNLNAN